MYIPNKSETSKMYDALGYGTCILTYDHPFCCWVGHAAFSTGVGMQWVLGRNELSVFSHFQFLHVT